MTPSQECQENVEFSIAEAAVSSHFLNKFILASTAHVNYLGNEVS